VGQGANLREAWDKAFARTSRRRRGGIIAVKSRLTARAGGPSRKYSSEVIVAPSFRGGRWRFAEEEKICGCYRSWTCPLTAQPWMCRSVGADSFLLQQPSFCYHEVADLKIVTTAANGSE